MGRAYNVIDADGHILEPLDLWEKYMDPNSATVLRKSSKARTARTSW